MSNSDQVRPEHPGHETRPYSLANLSAGRVDPSGGPYNDPAATLALKQLCTAVANMKASGAEQWSTLLERCLNRTPATSTFVVDNSGLLIANAGELDARHVEAAAAHLAQAMDRAATTTLGLLHSTTIRYRRTWLSGHRVQLSDGTWQSLGFAGPTPVEPLLRPPACEGADVWAPFLQWSLGSQHARASVLSDGTGLLVGFEPPSFHAAAENLAPHITLLLDRCDGALPDAGSPRFIAARFGTEWLTIVRVRLSRFRTLALGVVGPRPVAESRTYDLKRIMRTVLKRKLVTQTTPSG